MNSNVLEFYVKMKDLMSSGLVKLAQNSKRTFTQMDSHAKFFGSSIDQLRHKLKAVNEVRFGTVMKSEFRMATAEAKALEAQIARMEGRSRGTRGGGFLGKVGSFIAPVAIAASLMGFAKSSLSQAMQFDAQKTSFGVLTGSKAVGNDLAQNLFKLKQETIMGPTVYKQAQTLLGFGIAAQRVIPILKMLGDVSMGDANRLQHLTLAFAEVSAAGQLNGRRMLQFVNAGFNPLLEMHRTTGKSMAELNRMMHEGKISAEMLEGAFKSATSTGGRFNNMLNVMAESPLGKLKKLQGQWAAFKILSGEVIMPIATGLMDWGAKLLSVVNHSEKLSQTLTGQRTEITGLIKVITSLNEGDATRKMMLQGLLDKYPELFKGLDAETAKNQQLLSVLTQVNGEYNKRIQHAGSQELHDEYQKYYRGASSRQSHFLIMRDFIEQGKYAEAKILNDRSGAQGSLMDYQFNDNYKKNVLAQIDRMIKNTTKEANKYKMLDQNVMASDNAAFINNEMLPFYNSEKGKPTILKGAKKMAAFVKEMNAMYSAIGMPGYKGTADPSKLAGYDFSKIKSMMTAAGIKTAADADAGAGAGSGSVANSVTSGGPRIINIHGVKFADKIELHAATGDLVMNDFEKKMKELFLRTLNSGAAVQ